MITSTSLRAAKKLKYKEICEYLQPNLDCLTTAQVEECVDKNEIHPAIIIGKLAHYGKISYVNQRL